MSYIENVKNKNDYNNFLNKNELKPTLKYHNFKDVDELELVLLGDEHIGSKFYDRKFHRKILDYIERKNMHVILMGDELETATRYSVGAGIYEQEEHLENQMEECISLYKNMAKKNKILGIHPGNHELRVYKESGIDITKVMAKELKISYLGVGKLHCFKVGKELYTLYTTHGNSGARMPHTKIKSAIDMENMVEANIYACGHLHQLSHHVKNFYKPLLRNKKVIEEQKHFLLTGSFLKHWGSYAHTKNMEPLRRGCVKIKLGGKKRYISVRFLEQ